MSLTMMALRISAVQALKAGNTLVGDNVLDSEISAIDLTADGQLQTKEQRPFIAVYTDAAKSKDLSRTGLRSNGQVDIMFNCGVSVTMAETNKETGEDQIVDLFPATDAGLEAILDGLDVQIGRVLVDPDNAWSQVFGAFVCAYVSKEHVRSSSSAQTVRLAAGQTKLTVETFADPSHGQPLGERGPWPRFLALLKEIGHPQFALFQQLLGETNEPPSFERLTGMTTSDAHSLRLYTPDGVSRGVVISDVAVVSGES